MTGTFPAYGMSPSLSTITSTSSSITSSIPDTEREYPIRPLGPADRARLEGLMKAHVETCLKGRGSGGGSAHSSYFTLQLPSGDTRSSLNSVWF